MSDQPWYNQYLLSYGETTTALSMWSRALPRSRSPYSSSPPTRRVTARAAGSINDDSVASATYFNVALTSSSVWNSAGPVPMQVFGTLNNALNKYPPVAPGENALDESGLFRYLRQDLAGRSALQSESAEIERSRNRL